MHQLANESWISNYFSSKFPVSCSIIQTNHVNLDKHKACYFLNVSVVRWKKTAKLVSMKRKFAWEQLDTYCKHIDIFSSSYGWMSWLCDTWCCRIVQADAPSPSLQLLLSCHQFPFPSPLAVSPCRHCILFSSFSQLDPSLFPHWLFAFSVSLPEGTEGIRQWPQYSRCTHSCAGWHRRDGSAHVVTCCHRCCCCRGTPGGRR